MNQLTRAAVMGTDHSRHVAPPKAYIAPMFLVDSGEELDLPEVELVCVLVDGIIGKRSVGYPAKMYDHELEVWSEI